MSEWHEHLGEPLKYEEDETVVARYEGNPWAEPHKEEPGEPKRITQLPPKVIDMTGWRFGKLTVQKYVGKNKHNAAVWECRCDCGNTHYAVGQELRQGSTKSCGCLRQPIQVGDVYGLLTVTAYAGKKGKDHVWDCKCECGKYKKGVKTSALTRGNVRSCGCLRRKRIDLTGKYFGRLLVIGDSGLSRNNRQLLLCLCSCGKGVLATSTDLKQGKQQSCGCLHRDQIIARNKSTATHRSTHTRLYSTWIGIKNRCYNKNDHNWINYGARGIKVCDTWNKDFIAFRDWALENGYADTLSIERIDVNRDYAPENCMWIPSARQQRNKRNTVRVNGKPLRDIAEELGLNSKEYETVYSRYARYGWPLEEALGLARRDKVRGKYTEFSYTPVKGANRE